MGRCFDNQSISILCFLHILWPPLRVSVVISRARGRMFKYTYGCSHTVQKPSISPWLFLDNARFIYLTIYPRLLLLFLTATRMERLVLFFQEPVAEAAQELRYFLTITLFCTLMILLDPIPLVTSLCYN